MWVSFGRFDELFLKLMWLKKAKTYLEKNNSLLDIKISKTIVIYIVVLEQRGLGMSTPVEPNTESKKQVYTYMGT